MKAKLDLLPAFARDSSLSDQMWKRNVPSSLLNAEAGASAEDPSAAALPTEPQIALQSAALGRGVTDFTCGTIETTGWSKASSERLVRVVRRGAFGLCVLLASFVALTLSATSASASIGRSYDGHIAGFTAPRGIAIGPNQSVWIADPGNGGLISEYDAYPSQTLEGTQAGVGHFAGSPFIYGLALNASTGYLYVAESQSVVIQIFDNTGNFLEEWIPSSDTRGLISVAVDNSGGVSTGRVYLSRTVEPDGVQAFTPSHGPVSFAHEPYITGNEITGTPAGPFAGSPGGTKLATDSEGNLYVVDSGNAVVDEFNSSGEFVRAFTGAGAPGGFSGALSGVAVDPSNGNVLIVNGNVVDEFTGTGEYLSQLIGTPEGPFGSLSGGIAINSSGYIYLSDDGTGVVDIFTPTPPLPIIEYGLASNQTQTSGTLNATIALNGDPEITGCTFQYGTSEGYGLSAPCSPATPYSTATAASATISNLTPDTTYHYRLVLTTVNGIKRGGDQTFTPHAVAGVTTEPASDITRTSATLTGSFIGNDEETHYYFEWGTTAAYGHSTPVPQGNAGSPNGPNPTSLSAELSQLTPQTTYHYRLVATNSVGTTVGVDRQFTLLPAVVGISTEGPIQIGTTNATLTGSFIGNDEETLYYFEWGTTAAYGNATPVPPGSNAGSPSGPGPTPLSTELTHLDPLTTYHYRVVATNGVGTTFGNDQTLKTKPSAPLVSESVSDVHSDSASLQAEINPGGEETTYHFEYGLGDCSFNPCTSIPVPGVAVGSGSTPLSVSAQISGLTTGTTFHYRVVAVNALGTTDGLDQTFTTFPQVARLTDSCPNALARQQTGASLLLDCRAYELVSAANTGGYDVSSDLTEGEEAAFPVFPQAENPSRVLYSVDHGAIPGTNHPTNRGSDPYVATRGESGWSTEYVGVPANDPFASGPFSSVPSGADATLDSFAFDSPEGCSPCLEGDYAGIPVRLADGELVQGMVPAPGITPPPSAVPDGHIAKELSANGQHFIFGSTSQFAPNGNDETGDVSIYDRNLKTGETHVVSDNENGEPLPCLQGAGRCNSAEHDSNGIAELDISENGSHILLGQKVVSDAAGNLFWHLYMNIGDSERAIPLTPGAAEGVRFDGMTSDGSEVFFSSEEHLTREDEGHNGADIYMWSQKGEEEGEPLALISKGERESLGEPGDTSSCEPVAVSGHEHWNTGDSVENCGVLAIGGGGGVALGSGSIYFLSPEMLDGPGHGVPNAPNLYLARPGSTPHFIATLESSLTGSLQYSHHPFLRNIGTFSNPDYVAVDRSGGASNNDVYVDDRATNTISKFDAAGSPVTSWEEGGKLSTGPYRRIAAITVGPSGTLYVQTGGCEILEFSQAGTPLGTIEPGCAEPHGLAADAAGNLYASLGSSIQKFSSSGAELGTVLAGVSATAIAIDPVNGDLYIDNEGETIERYSFNGSGEAVEPQVIASGLAGAAGIAVDSAHDVYVAEPARVLEFAASGEEVGVAIGVGILHGSTGVAVGEAGEVYVGNPGHFDLAEFGPPESAPNPRADNPLILNALAEAETSHTADFQVSPSGQFAVFTSTLSLTGFESADYPQVYRYDAVGEKLDCASCDPTGAKATGAASLASTGSSLTEAGQVFFNSEEALALNDTDNLTDVYEWEPEGTGGCSSEAATFSKVSGNCLGLISSGSSPFNSRLLGVSADGTDAYFFTHDSLTPQNENGELVKIYDARVNGGFFVIPSPPDCKASDECHGAGTSPPPPPDFQNSGGATGNEVETPRKTCRPGFVKKDHRCVKRPKRHRRAHHDRNKSAHHRGGRK